MTMHSRLLSLSTLALPMTLAGCVGTPKPRAERWNPPPVGTSWETAQRNTGSYGADALVKVTRTSDGEWAGRPAIIFTNDRGGALRVHPETGHWFAMVTAIGAPLVTFEPALGWTFPLEVGKAWTTRHRMTLHAAGGRAIDYDLSCQVEAFEKVTVPAGSFDTFRIACRTTIDNAETFWTSPELGIMVKSNLRRGPGNPIGAGTQYTELVAQTIRR